MDRILAVAPSSRGFGFAVLEGKEKLVDWGVRSIRGDKNACTVSKIEELIAYYRLETIVLEDYSASHSQRSARIRTLGYEIMATVERKGIRVVVLSREQVRKTFFGHEKGTKHAIAENLSARFPAELGSRLPPKRRPWMSEDYRMDIFDAVSLALASRPQARKKSYKYE